MSDDGNSSEKTEQPTAKKLELGRMPTPNFSTCFRASSQNPSYLPQISRMRQR